MATILNGFPPPLGNGSFPSMRDVRLFIAAFSIYSLLSIPTALILFGIEKVLPRLKRKANSSLVDLKRMDLFLLFGWGLLWFKWISNLMPFLLDGKHLPNIPYFLMVPLLGIHLWMSRFSKKTTRYYRLQWMIIILGTIFLSKTAYDIFIGSSFSISVKLSLFVFFVIGGFLITWVFHNLLYTVVKARVKPEFSYAFLFIILLTGSVIVTHNALQAKNHAMDYLSETAYSQGSEGVTTKNVIIVLVDCLRADHLGYYGYMRKTSPFLDHIARSGVAFENCIAPSSWTIPSVVSLFTGVYPQQHGMNSLGTVIPQDLSMLQEIMEKNGVETAAFNTNDFLKPSFGYAKGFSHYFDHYLELEFNEYVASRLFFLNALLHFKNDFFYPRSVDPGGARWWSIGFSPFNHEKRSAQRVTDDVIKWIDAHHARPFYIYLHYMDVHSPYDTIWYPLFDRERYDSQGEKEQLINTYDGRITYVDQQVKRIWETLVRLKVSENTLVIITADHGEELYDHEGTGHCTTLYEELIRVPLIMINPLLSAGGRKVETQIQLIDLPVTVLDFLDLQVPKEMVGQSLLPLIAGVPSQPGPSSALSYTTRGRKSLRTEEGRVLWREKVWRQDIVLNALRVDNEWKIIVGNDGRTEFYNLKEDAKEKNDLKKIEKTRVSGLKKKLMEKSAGLENYVPTQKKPELSPDTKNRLRALGYLSF